MSKNASRNVESSAVDVTSADKQPHWMTHRVRNDGQARCEETKRPENALLLISRAIYSCCSKINFKKNLSYHSDGLNRDDESIRSQIARIRQRVLLPDLSSKGLQTGDLGMMKHEIAFEEKMRTARCFPFHQE